MSPASTAPAVELLYFAAIRDAVGLARETVPLPQGVTTLRQLSGLLERRHPALAGRLAQVRFAVNETFSELDAVLASGDVVAVIPPVSGG